MPDTYAKSPSRDAVIATSSQIEDETTPLFSANPFPRYSSLDDPEHGDTSSDSSDEGESCYTKEATPMYGVLSVLLIGVFVSQADTSLVLATYGEIASDFGQLENAGWLLSTYILAMCTAQPLYGKLSDIFGRKSMLQISYGLFAIGTTLCGLSTSMGFMIAARAIEGVGGAGMVCLVSILITDLVPLREVASYRSYVNIAQTVGRSCGGAIGGWLAQVVGWKWAFLGQVPLVVIAMALVAWKLEPANEDDKYDDTAENIGIWAKVKRIDFLGAGFMSLAILSILFAVEMGSSEMPWTSPIIFILAGIGVAAAVLFCLTEKLWAKEPIFPLELLSHYDVVTSYAMLSVQTCSQMALMLYIPLYFQVTRNSSPGEAGAYLIPAVVGNTAGGLLTGAYIKWKGHYKMPTIISSLSSGVCFILLVVFWRGDTPPWQSLFVFLAGFGTGVAHSSIFVAVSAGVGEKKMAIAGSGLYLSSSVGGVAGVAAGSSVFQTTLRNALSRNLQNVEKGEEVARKALSDIRFVQHLSGKVHNLVVDSYVSGFHNAFILCLCFAGFCLLVSLVMREKRL